MASLICIAAGALLGTLRPPFLRRLERRSAKALDILLSLLLFSSSLTFGSDPSVTASLASLGMASAVTALLALAGSALAAYLWRASVGRNVAFSPTKREDAAEASVEDPDPQAGRASVPSKKWASALPFVSVMSGWLSGMALQSGAVASLEVGAVAGMGSSLSLSALLLVIGYDAGKERIWNTLWRYGPLAATLPVVAGAASILGAGLAALLVSRPFAGGLAAGSGFGWYSLAGAMTLARKGAEAGAYVFLSNLIREILTLLIVPVISGASGPQIAASMGGATSMDSTLPVISREFGSDGIAWGLITGTTLSIACPFILGFFLRF